MERGRGDTGGRGGRCGGAALCLALALALWSRRTSSWCCSYRLTAKSPWLDQSSPTVTLAADSACVSASTPSSSPVVWYSTNGLRLKVGGSGGTSACGCMLLVAPTDDAP